MKTTLEELRNNNAGYAFGKSGITEADLQKINEIIECIEQSRTKIPQKLDCVVYTDEYGNYYPDAIIDGETYGKGSFALCERGSAHVDIDYENKPFGSISGGSFPSIDKNKLKYIGTKEKWFWTFSTMGAGANQGLYFKAEVSCFELNNRPKIFRKYTTQNYDCIYVQDMGDMSLQYGYQFTVRKNTYSFCAFKEESELKAFLARYKAVEEPYWGNENGTKKYWILKIN